MNRIISSDHQTKPDCRICYSQEPYDELLVDICNCKGYMSAIHQSCLLKWIEVKAHRKCEVCHHQLPLVEKMSFKKFFNLLFLRFFSSRKRCAKFTIYMLYLYLFFRRLSSIFSQLYQLLKVFLIHRSIKKRSGELILLKQLPKWKIFIIVIINFLYLVYSFWVLANVIIIGYSEACRIAYIIRLFWRKSQEIQISIDLIRKRQQKREPYDYRSFMNEMV